MRVGASQAEVEYLACALVSGAIPSFGATGPVAPRSIGYNFEKSCMTAPPAGFEPAHTAPEAVALSPELWGLAHRRQQHVLLAAQEYQ
jgi:hypothetical protein